MALSGRKSRKGNFSRILTICLIFGGGLLVLALLYNAFFSNTDTRSKAAVPEAILKTWNFDSDAEGWSVKGVPSSVQSGRLTFPLGHSGTPVVLSYGQTVPVPDTSTGKKLKVRIAAAFSGTSVLGAESNDDEQESVIPGAPSWFALVPENLRNFLELLYLWIFVYQRPSNMSHLLEGLVNTTPPDTECIQVIQPARNTQTGECKEFPTPCDVPEGWETVDTCVETGRRPTPTPTCRPRPACLDSVPRCLIAETPDMCPPTVTPTSRPCTEPPACLFGDNPCRQAPPVGGWCLPPTSRVLMQVTSEPSSLKTRLTTAAIPIDGVMREYDLSLTTVKNLALQFNPQLAVSSVDASGFSMSSVGLYVDWMKVAYLPTPQCVVSGCTNEQCVDIETAKRMAQQLCVPVPNVCYSKAKCEIQSTGQCGWTHTAESRSCLENPPKATPTPKPPPGCYYQQVQCFAAPCDPILVCQSNTPTPASPCKATGCSGQLCSDQELTTTCEAKPEYACYKTATCTRLNTGQCGWVQTPALQSCIENARNPSAAKPCKVTGCSSELCAEEELMSTCQYKPEYACYQNGTCTRQNNGQCGWTQTDALTSCIESARSGNSTVSF